MKKLLKLIKYIHHFTNHEVKPEDEARDILQFMLLRSSTTHTMEIMESLEEQFKAEMLLRKLEAEKVCKAVNNKYVPHPVKPTYMELLVKDPVFEKPYASTFPG